MGKPFLIDESIYNTGRGEGVALLGGRGTVPSQEDSVVRETCTVVMTGEAVYYQG